MVWPHSSTVQSFHSTCPVQGASSWEEEQTVGEEWEPGLFRWASLGSWLLCARLPGSVPSAETSPTVSYGSFLWLVFSQGLCSPSHLGRHRKPLWSLLSRTVLGLWPAVFWITSNMAARKIELGKWQSWRQIEGFCIYIYYFLAMKEVGISSLISSFCSFYFLH